MILEKRCHFYIDDVIWVFRDLARQRPASLFDNKFLSHLKEAHDKYGLKTQLNVFYRTDFYYGDDEFTLADMPDCYKAEWEANSDWLKLAFHAKQEFPDYPYINASYETVKNNFEAVKNEIIRFAGEKTFTYTVNTHWLPVSYDGCRAYYDCGVRLISLTHGDVMDNDEYVSKLPYGHLGRMLQDRKPDTGIFMRKSKDIAINVSLKGYNHIPDDIYDKILFNQEKYFDEKTGLYFKSFSTGMCCLNLNTPDEVREAVNRQMGKEYVCAATHEQYFYEDYYAYQPDYAEKTLIMAEILYKNGYKSMFPEEFVK